jgi:putative SOS response-associated peptidase YedK
MPANALMRSIHNMGNNPHRMPAILRREDVDVWLNGADEEARSVLTQYNWSLMDAFEVGTRVIQRPITHQSDQACSGKQPL